MHLPGFHTYSALSTWGKKMIYIYSEDMSLVALVID